MMKMYYVKTDLAGLPKGRVERFALQQAALHESEGSIELYDEKNKRHVEAKAKQERDAEEYQRAQNARLAREFANRKAS